MHDKYQKIQLAITAATLHAAYPRDQEGHGDVESRSTTGTLQKLIEEQKAFPNTDKTRRVQIIKDIRKEVKRHKDEQRAAKIDKILANFSQIKSIKAIKNRKKRDITIGMKDADGKLMNDKTSITEIFAKFYAELYRSRRDEKAR